MLNIKIGVKFRGAKEKDIYLIQNLLKHTTMKTT